MRLVAGKDLTPRQRMQVAHDFMRHGGNEQWVAEHAFYITNKGNLSRKHRHCEPAYMAAPDNSPLRTVRRPLTHRD